MLAACAGAREASVKDKSGSREAQAQSIVTALPILTSRLQSSLCVDLANGRRWPHGLGRVTSF